MQGEKSFKQWLFVFICLNRFLCFSWDIIKFPLVIQLEKVAHDIRAIIFSTKILNDKK